MKVYLNEISGLWQAIVSMYLSKRTWTREKEQRIMEIYERNFDRHGKLIREEPDDEMKKLLVPLFKWAPLHITMGKFIDFRFTVEGLHRGAQDDFDSHAKRFDNRIIRSSTRLANYGAEKSDWYHDKIITTDEMLSHLKIDLPKEFEGKDGTKYVRVANGYVKEADAENHDVTRGLLMLSIPSNFTFACNCTEFAHIVKERDKNSHAAPELRDCIEGMLQQIHQWLPYCTREFFYSVKN